MQIQLNAGLIKHLHNKGINTLWTADSTILPLACKFEPPCSIKWMSIHHSCTLGAFSYGVSGYFFATHIGRYVSIAQNVQSGRGDHPVDWLSTSPIQYLDRNEFFECGSDFPGGEDYHQYNRFSTVITRPPQHVKPIHIGHDVWIGFGAYIKPGVTIGNGAIVAGHAVVTKNIPPYAIVAGNPARVKKMRFSDKIIERLEQIAWWQYAVWSLKDIAFDKVETAIEQIEQRKANGLLKAYEPGYVDLETLVHHQNRL